MIISIGESSHTDAQACHITATIAQTLRYDISMVRQLITSARVTIIVTNSLKLELKFYHCLRP